MARSGRPSPIRRRLMAMAAAAPLAVLGAGCSQFGSDTAVSATDEASSTTPAAGSQITGTVTRIVDGDTLHVEVDGETRKVRLLNIDAPESVAPNQAVMCLGPEASARLAELLPVGSTVELEYDGQPLDRYGRDLAIVTRPGEEMANIAMAKAGLAVPYDDRNNRTFHPQMVAATGEAIAAGVGLFSKDADCTLAHAVAGVQREQGELAALGEPATLADAQAMEVKAVAAVAAAGVVLEGITSNKFFEARAMSKQAVNDYRGTVEGAKSSAETLQGALAAKVLALGSSGSGVPLAGGAAATAPDPVPAPEPAPAQPVAPRDQSQSGVECPIKGNINSKKERIYHVPGQRDYDKTIIDESKGERWFCTAEEARAAGWRAAMR